MSVTKTPEEEKRFKWFKRQYDEDKARHEKEMKRIKRARQVYAGKTDDSLGENIISNLRIRWAKQRFRVIASKIIDPEVRLEFRPVEPGDSLNSTALQRLVDQQFKSDQFIIKQIGAIEAAGIDGICVWMPVWLQRHETLNVRLPQTPMSRTLGQKPIFEEKRVIVEDRPTLVRIPIDDFIPDHKAKFDHDMRRCHHIVYVTPAELKERAERGLYKNTEEVLKEHQNRMLGSDTNRIKLIQSWFNDGTRMITCGETVLLDEPNKFHHKNIPYICWSTIPNLDSIYGESEMEDIEELQKAIWIKDNQRIDAVNFSMFPIIIADPGIPDIDNLKLHPGKIIPAMQGHRLEQWQLNPASSIAFQETESYIGAMDAMTGYSTVIGGAEPSDLARVAATTSSIAQEEGNVRIAVKKLLFRLAVARVAKLWLQLDNQFMTEFSIRRILGDVAGDYKPIAPDEIPMFVDVIPASMNEAVSRTQQQNALREALNLVGSLHGQPALNGTKIIDISAIISELVQAYDIDPSRVFVDPPQQNEPMPTMKPNQVPPAMQDTQIKDEVNSASQVMNT